MLSDGAQLPFPSIVLSVVSFFLAVLCYDFVFGWLVGSTQKSLSRRCVERGLCGLVCASSEVCQSYVEEVRE